MKHNPAKSYAILGLMYVVLISMLLSLFYLFL
jgi:hypothetical protein